MKKYDSFPLRLTDCRSVSLIILNFWFAHMTPMISIILHIWIYVHAGVLRGEFYHWRQTSFSGQKKTTSEQWKYSILLAEQYAELKTWQSCIHGEAWIISLCCPWLLHYFFLGWSTSRKDWLYWLLLLYYTCILLTKICLSYISMFKKKWCPNMLAI